MKKYVKADTFKNVRQKVITWLQELGCADIQSQRKDSGVVRFTFIPPNFNDYVVIDVVFPYTKSSHKSTKHDYHIVTPNMYVKSDNMVYQYDEDGNETCLGEAYYKEDTTVDKIDRNYQDIFKSNKNAVKMQDIQSKDDLQQLIKIAEEKTGKLNNESK